MKIILAQQNLAWEAPAQNRLQLEQWFRQFPADVDMVILPEMFTTGFSMTPTGLAEQMGGTTHQWLQQWAKVLDAAIVGSLIIEAGNKYYNRLLWVHPDGRTEYYDKRHLFTLAGEQHHYQAGKDQLIVSYQGWRIMPLICYDLRFPVWSRNNMDYDLLLYVANFPDKRGHAWRSLLTARAIENQSYTIGLNRVGTDGNGIYYAGDSCLIDYAGQTQAHLPPRAHWQMVTLDKATQQSFRKKLAFLPDRDTFSLEL